MQGQGSISSRRRCNYTRTLHICTQYSVSTNTVSDLRCPVVQPLTRIRTMRCVTDQVLGTIINSMALSIDGMTKRSRPMDEYSCLYSGDNLYPEDLFSAKHCVACVNCLACATRSRTYMRNGSSPLKAGACCIDDASMTLPGPLNSGLMHADFEHDVDSDGLVPTKLL